MPQIALILGELYFLGMIISGIVRTDFITEPVLWVAVILEVICGLLAYNIYKLYLIRKTYLQWILLYAMLTVICVAAPIILYYKYDSLEPVRGTWMFYLFTVNSYMVYRIIRNRPILREGKFSGHI